MGGGSVQARACPHFFLHTGALAKKKWNLNRFNWIKNYLREWLVLFCPFLALTFLKFCEQCFSLHLALKSSMQMRALSWLLIKWVSQLCSRRRVITWEKECRQQLQARCGSWFGVGSYCEHRGCSSLSQTWLSARSGFSASSCLVVVWWGGLKSVSKPKWSL